MGILKASRGFFSVIFIKINALCFNMTITYENKKYPGLDDLMEKESYDESPKLDEIRQAFNSLYHYRRRAVDWKNENELPKDYFIGFSEQICCLHSMLGNPKVIVSHDARQIINPNEFEKGRSYINMHLNEDAKYKTQEEFVFDTIEGKKIICKDGKKFFLGDSGVVSYENDFWNAKNFVIPLGKDGKPVQLDKSKIHERACYVEKSLVDGAYDDFDFATEYFGPFNNLDEAYLFDKAISYMFRKRIGNDGRTYVSTSIYTGNDYSVRELWDVEKIISPEKFYLDFVGVIKETEKIKEIYEKIKKRCN